jgi:hypothetical protein
MKKKCYLLLFQLTTLTTVLIFFPLSGFAQTGKNDSTFNIPDGGLQALH